MTEKSKITKKGSVSKKTKAKPAKTKGDKEKVEKLKESSLNGRLLHLTIDTDLEDQEQVDELHDKIEERIERKLKQNGVENCIVFVSGPNIKVNLM